MLENPEIEDDRIAGCLQDEYGLAAREISFLPLGADVNTAVYRVGKRDGGDYFLKLRRGALDQASVAVPKYLSDHGMKQVIAPLPTRHGELWAGLAPFKVILYPYFEGWHGYARKLSPQQWNEFGAALKAFHSAHIPPAITSSTSRETFSPHWREVVEAFLDRVERENFVEPVAAQLAAFLKTKQQEALELVRRAGRLAGVLQSEPPEYILCHGDIHGWNLLIGADEALYIVDWDTLIFAPKERDLMFIGGGLADSGYAPEQEEAMFFQGYGPTRINQAALAYYRYERIVEDIAAYCEQLLLSDEGGEDRAQSLEYLISNFLPNGTIKTAYRSDKTAQNA